MRRARCVCARLCVGKFGLESACNSWLARVPQLPPHAAARTCTHGRRLTNRIKLRDAAVAALPEELQEEAKKIDTNPGMNEERHFRCRREERVPPVGKRKVAVGEE